MSELDFFEFIYDRQVIWHKRFVLKEPPPWTDDRILSRYIFTNVFRELDKGTQHLISEVLKRDDLSVEAKLYNALLYRRFNIFGFFGEIVPKPIADLDPAGWAALIPIFDAHRQSGKNLYSIAYNICQVPIDKNFRPKDKHVQLILSVKDAVERRLFCVPSELSADEAFKIMRKAHGVGDFLAYQLLLDMSYIPGVRISGLDRFVFVGPGAMGGLEIMGVSRENPAEAVLDLMRRQDDAFNALGVQRNKHWGLIGRPLVASNIQGSLCEFRKYINLKNDEKSHKKRIYVRKSV